MIDDRADRCIQDWLYNHNIKLIDWLNGFHVSFQLNYAYVETDDDNEDEIEICTSSQGQWLCFTSKIT